MGLMIGEVARRSGLSTSALRYYERAGLLPPPMRVSKRRVYEQKVLGRIRHLRGNGRLNNSKWHARITGEGIFAEQIANIFEVSCRRVGMGARPKLSTASFRRPKEQLELFR